MFISGGENVYPAEVERVLKAHPAVAEAAVVGAPHPRWGEAGHAFVVLEPGARADEAGLLEHCRKHLAGYKAPRRVILRQELPRTPLGKVRKFLLLEEARASSAGPAPTS
jgi:acyl-CoA synthetase (AMP-forming)/AMP-acid ligase II